MVTAHSRTAGPGDGQHVIDLSHVSKVYKGRVHALRGIEMHVRRGEIFGLLGPNGAGKTTLVKILMTVLRPTRCAGTLLGQPVGTKSALRRVGYLPEHHRFSDYLTGAEVLDYYGAMSLVPRRERRQRAGELLDLVGMSAWAKKRVRSYSKGMRQRIGIAQALINDPELILLDEPTDGVDPVGRRDIRVILQRLRDEGKTVFLNSHLLSELEMVCDRVSILVQGRVSSQGTLDELTKGQQRYEIEIVADDPDKAVELAIAALPATLTPDEPGATTAGVPARHVGWKGSLATGESVEIERHIIRVGTNDVMLVQPIIDALRRRGAIIRSVRPYRPSLEDLFMQAVTDPESGRALAPGAADGKDAR